MKLKEVLGYVRRRVRLILLVSFVLFLATWSFLYWPFLYHPLGLRPMPCADASPIALEEPVLFIGDLHVTNDDDGRRFENLRAFITDRGVGSLVILGDLFDTPGDYYALEKNEEGELGSAKALMHILGLEGLRLNTYVVWGGIHDPNDLELEVSYDGIGLQTLGTCARIGIGEVQVWALHGHEVFGGVDGFIASTLAGKPYLEGVWKDLTELPEGLWIIAAHSHVPGLNTEARVANTGGWTRVPLMQPATGKGILVKDGTVRLVSVTEGDLF